MHVSGVLLSWCAPLSLPTSAPPPSSLASVWDVLTLHPREGERRLFSWITNRAQGFHSSTLENLSGRSSSELPSVCPIHLPFLSSPLISFALSGPYAAGIFDPRSWGDHETETNITLELTRVVLAIGVFAIGVELPKAYMRNHWKSLTFLLVPVMTYVGGFPLSLSFNSHHSLRGGLFPLGSFMPSSPNSTSSHVSPLPRASPQPTLFLLRPSSEVNMPRNMSQFIFGISSQQSAVATMVLPSHSYSFPYTL